MNLTVTETKPADIASPVCDGADLFAPITTGDVTFATSTVSAAL
jgi:hypothetical protein